MARRKVETDAPLNEAEKKILETLMRRAREVIKAAPKDYLGRYNPKGGQ